MKNKTPECSGGTLLTWVTRKKTNATNEKLMGNPKTHGTNLNPPKPRGKRKLNEDNLNESLATTELTNKTFVSSPPSKNNLQENHQLNTEPASGLPGELDTEQDDPNNLQIPSKRRRQGSKNRVIDDSSDSFSLTPKSPETNKPVQKPTAENLTSVENTPPTKKTTHAKKTASKVTITPPSKTVSTPNETKRLKRVQSSAVAETATSQKAKLSNKKTTPKPTKLSQNQGLSMQGLRIVVTGVFDSFSRGEMIDHIKRNGGTCTTAVSGLTDILVAGSILEDNRPVEEGKKYQKAMELQESNAQSSRRIQILTEEEFLEKFPVTPIVNPDYTPSNLGMSQSEDSLKYTASQSSQPVSSQLLSSQPLSSQPLSSQHLSPQPLYSQPLSSQPLSSQSLSQEQRWQPNESSTREIQNSTLWAERWRPERLSDLMGNQDVAQKIISWLNSWKERLSASKTVSSKEEKGSKKRSTVPLGLDKNFPKAVLLSGPPGIGKTSMAHVLAAECGYDVIEYNASDDRGKSIVEVISDMASGGNTLTAFTHQSSSSNSLLIMDEMDGLSQGDRGGAQALLKLLEKSRCPVICICNDRYHPKLRTLASKCYDLTLHKPRKNVIAKRLCDLMMKEGFKVEYNAVESLCENVGNDIRQILNTLQCMAQTSSCVTYDAVLQELTRGVKDRQVMDSIFEVTKRLLIRSESSKMSLDEKLYGYFTDYDMTPLSMHENYITSFINCINNKSGSIDRTAIKTMAEVAECFTFGDMMNSKCRRQGYWTLLGDIGLFTVIIPSCKMSGFVAFPEFPKWLGRNSTATKNKRLLSELSLLTSSVTSMSPVEMQASGYNQLLYNRLLEPLLDASLTTHEAASQTIKMLQEYGLSKEHFIEHLHSMRFRNYKDSSYDQVSTATKRMLTTLSNANAGLIRGTPTAVKSKQPITPMVKNEDGDTETIAPIKEDLQEVSEQLPPEDDDEALLNKLISTKKKKKKPTASETSKRKKQR